MLILILIAASDLILILITSENCNYPSLVTLGKILQPAYPCMRSSFISDTKSAYFDVPFSFALTFVNSATATEYRLNYTTLCRLYVPKGHTD
jgi:hypothetical protein